MQSSLPSTSTSSSGSTSAFRLTPEVMQAFRPARTFKTQTEPDKSYTSVSFDAAGELMITSAEDETLQLWNCKTGKHKKALPSKKYGCNLARFTHHNGSIIYASTKGDDAIRYLSLHDNSFQAYFKGHKKRVVSLEMSPVDDTFLSGAKDDSVRFWDLRAKTCQGQLAVAAAPQVAYDPTGSVFIVVLNYRRSILWYDIRQFDKEPFQTTFIPDPFLPPEAIITSAKFSPNNETPELLVGMSTGAHYVLDGFDGKIKAKLEGHQPLKLPSGASETPLTALEPPVLGGEELSWTPDARYVVGGSTEGKIHIWDVSPPGHVLALDQSRPPPGEHCILKPMGTLQGNPGEVHRVVGFNHRLGMMCSAGREMMFWLPDPGSLGENAGGIGSQGMASL